MKILLNGYFWLYQILQIIHQEFNFVFDLKHLKRAQILLYLLPTGWHPLLTLELQPIITIFILAFECIGVGPIRILEN